MNHRPEEVRKVAKAICQVVTGGDCVMQERDRAPCTDQICRIMPIAREALARAALARNDRLEAALQRIADMCPATAELTLAHEMADIAMAALARKEGA